MRDIIRTLLFLLISMNAFAASSLDIVIEPKEPVSGEPFKVNFNITSSEGDNPVINFEPSSDLEIISRGNSRVSTRTSFINGKMTYQRKVTVSYDLVSNKAGAEFIKNVTVKFGSEVLKKSYVPIRILSTPRKARPVFVRAEVEKDQYFVGESILVRYYLYNKADVAMSATDVKKFPKLDKFLKRYHQETPNPQRVQIRGVPFERRVIYTAQLFGEEPGQYKVDPISLNARYSERANDPFRSFGFGGLGMGGIKSRTIRSETLKIDVLPLPTAGRPENFTGLVGEHTFRLSYNKSKYLANEPIELQLVTEGEGALELFEAPKILRDDLIEEFETTADLKINQDFTATKTFDYTYLGRGNVKIPAQTLKLSFFDPLTKSYKTKKIELAEFEVVAVGKTISPENRDMPGANQVETTANPLKTQSSESSESFLMQPVYKAMSSYVYYAKHLFWIVGIGLFVVVGLVLFKLFQNMQGRSIGIMEEIKREGLNYRNFYQVFEMISNGETLKEKIQNSPLGPEAKNYFLETYLSLSKLFNSEKHNSEDTVRVKPRYFKELNKKVEEHANF